MNESFKKAMELSRIREIGISNYAHMGLSLCGIALKYYPKFEGFPYIQKRIEEYTHLNVPYKEQYPLLQLDIEQFNTTEMDYLYPMVEKFYYEFYWDKLRLNEVQDIGAAFALFNSSLFVGKPKTVKKAIIACRARDLEVVTVTDELLAAINSSGKTFPYRLILELIESFSTLDSINNTVIKKLLGLYFTINKLDTNSVQT